MSAGQPSPASRGAERAPKAAAAGKTVKILGMDVPVQPWALACMSLVVVLVVTCMGGIYVWKNWKEAQAQVTNATSQVQDLHQQTQKLEKAKSDSEKSTLAKLEEYKNHFNEKGQVLTPPNGWVKVTTFPSDGCILISRKGTGDYNARIDDWILSPLRTPKSAPPDTKATPATFSNARPPSDIPQSAPAEPPVELRSTTLQQAIRRDFAQADRRLMPVQANCLNPHPGSFQSSWGAANGCWVPFFRKWPDGCNHYQWYNSCSGYWDKGIHWNFCAARHSR
jgi:hypothetical protein